MQENAQKVFWLTSSRRGLWVIGPTCVGSAIGWISALPPTHNTRPIEIPKIPMYTAWVNSRKFLTHASFKQSSWDCCHHPRCIKQKIRLAFYIIIYNPFHIIMLWCSVMIKFQLLQVLLSHFLCKKMDSPIHVAFNNSFACQLFWFICFAFNIH